MEPGSSTTTPLEEATRLLEGLLARAERTEALSRRNGWSGEAKISVFPGTEFVDSLLDVRPLVSEEETVLVLLDAALAEHGRRPGVSTTEEVRGVCSSILAAIGGVAS